MPATTCRQNLHIQPRSWVDPIVRFSLSPYSQLLDKPRCSRAQRVLKRRPLHPDILRNVLLCPLPLLSAKLPVPMLGQCLPTSSAHFADPDKSPPHARCSGSLGNVALIRLHCGPAIAEADSR